MLFAIAPLLNASGAFADPHAPATTESPEQVTVTYTGDPGCPSEAQFVDELRERIRKPVRFGADGVVNLVITLQLGGATAMGKLEVQRGTMDPTRREFTGTTCREVGSALALVAALALDPNARTEQLPDRSIATGEASTTTPAAPPAAAPVASAASPNTSRSPSPAAQPPRSAPTYSGWIGPIAGVTVGHAPEALGLFGLSLGLRAATNRAFAPSLQLSPLWGRTGATGPTASDGDFEWAMGRLEACPLSIRLTSRARLDPCAALEVGRLSATGAASQVDVPLSRGRWWVAPGAAASLHFGFQGWFLRLGAITLLPITRDEFVFLTPERRVHQASPVTFGANLGLGFQLGE